MRYFIDTEFLEGTQKKLFGNTKPTIDLISIGIVAEDGREYYAISKDFNLKEAWNRYDLITNEYIKGFGYEKEYETEKVYWIRENVLKPIWKELFYLNAHQQLDHHYVPFNRDIIEVDKLYSKSNFTYKSFKKLINKYGKTNKQIAKEIVDFCKPVEGHIYLASTNSYEQVNIGRPNTIVPAKYWTETIGKRTPPEFYGYYCDYDWVVFCWLFGKMIDLPKGFPQYCVDLNQESDRIYNLKKEEYIKGGGKNFINKLSNHLDYPKQTNTHNALGDARFNYELYKFLKTL